MKLTRFAGAILVVRQTITGFTAKNAPILVKARSKAEAEGLALQRAREDWPIEHGWSQHQAIIMEITEKWLLS